jgi:hypothetical protein
VKIVPTTHPTDDADADRIAPLPGARLGAEGEHRSLRLKWSSIRTMRGAHSARRFRRKDTVKSPAATIDDQLSRSERVPSIKLWRAIVSALFKHD